MKHDYILLTTHTCHCSNIEQALRDLEVVYERCYVEEHPELMERHKIKHCPVLIIDETRVIAVDSLTEGQLKDLLNQGKESGEGQS